MDMLELISGMTEWRQQHPKATPREIVVFVILQDSVGEIGTGMGLSEFRTRLIIGGAEARLFTALLQIFQARGLVNAGGRQRTDSTHVLATIRQLNRYELVGESLRNALNQLTHLAPDWLKTVVQADWYERYGRRFDLGTTALEAANAHC